MIGMRDFIAGLSKQSAATLSAEAGLGVTPGWDSFAQLNIMMELESRYGIDINDETIRKYSLLSEILLLESENGEPDDRPAY